MQNNRVFAIRELILYITKKSEKAKTIVALITFISTRIII